MGKVNSRQSQENTLFVSQINRTKWLIAISIVTSVALGVMALLSVTNDLPGNLYVYATLSGSFALGALYKGYQWHKLVKMASSSIVTSTPTSAKPKTSLPEIQEPTLIKSDSQQEDNPAVSACSQEPKSPSIDLAQLKDEREERLAKARSLTSNITATPPAKKSATPLPTAPRLPPCYRPALQPLDPKAAEELRQHREALLAKTEAVTLSLRNPDAAIRKENSSEDLSQPGAAKSAFVASTDRSSPEEGSSMRGVATKEEDLSQPGAASGAPINRSSPEEGSSVRGVATEEEDLYQPGAASGTPTNRSSSDVGSSMEAVAREVVPPTASSSQINLRSIHEEAKKAKARAKTRASEIPDSAPAPVDSSSASSATIYQSSSSSSALMLARLHEERLKNAAKAPKAPAKAPAKNALSAKASPLAKKASSFSSWATPLST